MSRPVEAALAGTAVAADWVALAPLFYGQWDDVTQAHARAAEATRLPDAPAPYYAAGAPVATAEELAELDVPVLLLAGEVDPMPAAATVREAARRGSLPWLNNPASFRHTVGNFLAG